MKKYITFLFVFLFVIGITGCSGDKDVEKGADVLNSQSEDARNVQIGITYKKGAFVGSNEKTEITLYIDEVNIGTINCDDKKIFIMSLAPGNHVLKTQRTEDDIDTYEFEIEKNDGQALTETVSFGLLYNIHGIWTKTELKEYDFPEDVSEEDYIRIDKKVEQNNIMKSSSNSEQYDLTDILNERPKDITTMADSITAMGVSLKYSEEENSYESDNGGLLIEKSEDTAKPAITATSPEFLIYGVRCGMSISESIDILNGQGYQLEQNGDDIETCLNAYYVNDYIVVINGSDGMISVIQALISPETNEQNQNTSTSEEINTIPSSEENEVEQEAEVAEQEQYILPESSERYMSEEDFVGLDSNQIGLAINEIYARHGRIFTDKYYHNYFSSKDWYEGTIDPEDFDESVFNDFEKSNIDLLASYRDKIS